MDDHCVYSRSILGRMVSTFSSSANGEGMYSQSQPTGNFELIQPIQLLLEW